MFPLHPPQPVSAGWTEFRRSQIGTLLLLATLTLTARLPATSYAQGMGSVVKDAVIFTGDGTTLEGASILIRGGKIQAVGTSVKAGMMTRSIPAKGKYVTPGLIDPWCTIGLDWSDQARVAGARAIDAFDRYQRDNLDAALRQGVTTVYLPARTTSGVGGLGAVVRLLPPGSEKDAVLLDEAALSAALGLSWQMRPLARAQAALDFRKAFKEAKQFRKSLEDYEEDIKEYEEKIKKRAEENAKRGAKKDDKKDEKKEEKVEPAKEPERVDRPRGRPEPRPQRRPGPPRGDRPERRDEARSDAPKPDESKDSKDDIKKPVEPAKDRNKETLLRVIDGKLALRVEAHRPEDILNALELAREFNLALAIEGGSGAVAVADKLAEADVPVILAAAPPAMQFNPGPTRYEQADAAVKLRRAGVRVLLGSGPFANSEGPTRNLSLAAARFASQTGDADAALKMITSDAATLLGVDHEIGRIASGMSADFVIWSAHPLSPDATVEQVYVRGREVFNAGRATPIAPSADEPEEPEKPEAESQPAEGGK